MIPVIPDEVPRPAPGPLEPVDEIPTVNEYYDGNIKLNVVQVKCSMYVAAGDCVRNSSCGWCGATKTCILGNSFGPQAPCVKSSFIYGAPKPNWNPNLNVINDKVGGVTSHMIAGPN